MLNKKIVIAGAGFTGAYIGRNLAEQGWQVRIVEIKDHIAGHMYDKVDELTGCLVHEYGPHIFHTDDEDIWNWLNKFSQFEPFNLKTQVFFESQQDWFTCSFGFHTVEKLFDKDKAKAIISQLKKSYPGRDKVSIPELMNSKNVLIEEFANLLWEEDYKPYTAKQWGLDPKEVDINILKRVPVYMSYYDKIHSNKYEALPKYGYTALFDAILDHYNIKVELSTDVLKSLEFSDGAACYDGKPTLFLHTGAIDELFDYEFGPLGYRSLRFTKEITKNDKNTKSGDPCVDIYPNKKYGYTRITNYGKLPIQNHLDYQVSAKEYSSEFKIDSNLGRYYPTLTSQDKIILEKYKNKADKINGLYLSGRLANYKYYDMDKALTSARDTLKDILRDNQ
ncbi:MAG TPA: NAD(P)-binding protein [Clostridiales bacterium]|nr:NAD(P)-binding protein [Clostridiales bacterium]